jgi:UDP:flavonoid glycosyltransferase YjiC (YdhE family)
MAKTTLMESPPKTLIAALNWGLGHATRCIPLIRELEAQGVPLVLASDGEALHLWRAEFPHLDVLVLPSYGIRYRSANMVRNMAAQLPRILWAIRAEHKTIGRWVQEHGIQRIISDNRYGCFHPKVHSVLLTHQLHLRVNTPWIQQVANGLLRLALRPFDEIWVPDIEGAGQLAGDLAHPPVSHPPVRYIGLLSRMNPATEPVEEDYDVAIVLSGPEPQRTILEQRLTEQAVALPYKCIVVQGKTQKKHHHYETDHVEVVSYLTSEALNEVLLRSRVVVCRSGYSSLMDLAVLGKKALLIPTPGQTEQEYLAEQLAQNPRFRVQRQDQLDLESALEGLLEGEDIKF